MSKKKTQRQQKMKGDPAFDSLVTSVARLAKLPNRLAARAMKVYTPVVDNILNSRCKDTRSIEQTLDGLLDFCFDPNVLLLYKKLCRYYYGIDPSATASYVHAYRDMWDSEKENLP